MKQVGRMKKNINIIGKKNYFDSFLMFKYQNVSTF